MTPKDIFIQAVGFLGTILFFLSYQCRKNKNLFRVQFASYVCYTTHLLMLGAVTGGISYILNTVRSFCLGSQNAFLKGKRMCAIICALQVITLCLTWENWWSVLPVAAKIRAAGMFVNSPLWIVYDIIVGSWAGVLDEIVTEASMIISICRYGWKNLDSTEN